MICMLANQIMGLVWTTLPPKTTFGAWRSYSRIGNHQRNDGCLLCLLLPSRRCSPRPSSICFLTGCHENQPLGGHQLAPNMVMRAYDPAFVPL